MALVAMTTADTVEFVSDLDPSKKKVDVPVDPDDPGKGTKQEVQIGDDASVFKIRPLDVFLMAHIYDTSSVIRGKQGDTEVGIHTQVNKTNIEAVRFGLVSLPDNFRDKHNHPVRIKTEKEVIGGREYQVVNTEVLNAMGTKLIGEMANKIKEISDVTPAEAKN